MAPAEAFEPRRGWQRWEEGEEKKPAGGQERAARGCCEPCLSFTSAPHSPACLRRMDASHCSEVAGFFFFLPIFFFFLKGIVSRILSSWQRSRCAKGESLLLLLVALRLAAVGALLTGRASFAFSLYPGFFFFFNQQVNGISRKVSFSVSQKNPGGAKQTPAWRPGSSLGLIAGAACVQEGSGSQRGGRCARTASCTELSY